MRGNADSGSEPAQHEERTSPVGRFLRLARVTAWPAYSLAFVSTLRGRGVRADQLVQAAVGFLALFMFAAFAFALNFYSDRDTDRYHDGVQKDFDLGRPANGHRRSQRQGMQVFCLATFVAASRTELRGEWSVCHSCVLACLIGGILYSHPRNQVEGEARRRRPLHVLVGVLIPSAGFCWATVHCPEG